MNENRPLSNLRRRYPPLILAVVLALALTLLWVVAGYAGWRGGWMATEFQVQNVDSVTADFTAHFYSPHGIDVITPFTGSIPPGRSAYYRPEATHGLPPDFTGTLRLESEQNIAGAIFHVAAPAVGFNGNAVFEMVADDITAQTYFAPLVERDHDGVTSQILVGNLGLTPATVEIVFYDPNGTPVPIDPLPPIPKNGSALLNLEEVDDLDSPFIGSAEIVADQPIWVDVVQVSDDRWAIYPAAPAGSAELYAPVTAQGVIPTISVQNVGDAATTVEVRTAAEVVCDGPVVLPPGGSWQVVPSVDWEDAYVIASTTGAPIAAVVSTRDTDGASAYTALNKDQASYCYCAPMLFADYDGWDTTLWMYNPNDSIATVDVAFAGTPGTASWADTVQIGPHETRASWRADVGTHYAARVAADKPIFVLVEGTAPGKGDGRLVYRATASPCPPTPIPTLTEWGYIVLAAFMVLVAAWTLRHRLHTVPVTCTEASAEASAEAPSRSE